MATPKRMRAKSIGHYILGKTIGEGTFGKVKLGTHILTGEKVAVKILEKERIVDVADVERVAREIHILKLLQHPHVIQLYEIIETPRQLYLIMEYCSGGELFDHIVASGRVREREACRFLHQIVAGVEQIHRMNVVHRDLKPENLLLDEHRNIKIVDFGLSNTFQEGQLLKTACGSPCYAAPEMIAGHRYVPSLCDIWSCGVILFALVCGYLPFEDQNTAALYRKILNADYQPPKFISDSVRDLIARMLTTDPEQRYTVQRIRAHAWYRQVTEPTVKWDGERGERMLEEDVLEQLDRFGFPRDYAIKCLQMNKHNHVTTTYYLLTEKKHRMAGRITNAPNEGDDFSAFNALANPDQQGMEVELMAEAASPDPGAELEPEAMGIPCMPKLDLNLGAAAHTSDADRAGGASPAPHGARQTKTPDGQGSGPNYGQWAQSLGLPAAPSSPSAGAREVSANNGSASGSTSAQGDPPASAPHPGQYGASGGGGSSSSHSPRVTESQQSYHTPRYAGGHAVPQGHQTTGPAPNSSQSPRKRSPIQQTMGFATPRGPVPSPPPHIHGASPSRGGMYSGRTEGGTPTGIRTGTPGKRPPPGTESGRASSNGTRPGTSQGHAPSRPMGGPATARGVNEARRRQYAPGQGVSDGGPGSARRASDRVASGSGAAAAAALASELCGTGVSTGGRASMGAPTSAWGGPSSRPGTSGNGSARASSTGANAPHGHGSVARAASASPDMSPPAAPEGPGAVNTGAAPMSAREARDEVMRTCRGAFNVSCTSSKAPKQILQEIQRALTLQRVSYKQATGFLVKCQRQNLRFEMEISHLDHLESIYVVRFRRVAGELVAYKELCSKVLAEMKI